jgi:hypothetical protein
MRRLGTAVDRDELLDALLPHPALVVLAHLIWSERDMLRPIHGLADELLPNEPTRQLFRILRESRRGVLEVDAIGLRNAVRLHAPALLDRFYHAAAVQIALLDAIAPADAVLDLQDVHAERNAAPKRQPRATPQQAA